MSLISTSEAYFKDPSVSCHIIQLKKSILASSDSKFQK